MPNYYVVSQDFGVAANVDAPDKRKARTTFLDYMQRHNYISWSQRQSLKPRLMLDKVVKGTYPTDIELEYASQMPIKQVEPEATTEPVPVTTTYGEIRPAPIKISTMPVSRIRVI